MVTIRQIAQKVANATPKDADRYDQIRAIKHQLIASGYRRLANDRETIDNILDVLFNEYSYKG